MTTAGDDEPPNQEEDYQRQRQACILACENSLWQQQEELDTHVCKLDRFYNNIEWKCLEVK